MGKQSKRDCRFELLRVIAMLAIIFCHIAAHGEMIFETPSLNSSITAIYGMGGVLVIISSF